VGSQTFMVVIFTSLEYPFDLYSTYRLEDRLAFYFFAKY
jgi:hypothetical protein